MKQIYKSIFTATILLLVMSACRTRPVTPSVLATPELKPSTTKLPHTPTHTPTIQTPTATLTITEIPTPTLGGPVWRILFKGAPCAELSSGCQPFEGTPAYLYTINSDGSDLKQEETFPENITLPRLSPHAKNLVYSTKSGTYVADTDATNPLKILDSWTAFDFSPDGEHIVYAIPLVDGEHPEQLQTQIGQIRLDGSEQAILTTLPVRASSLYVSPEGKHILIHSRSLNPLTNLFYIAGLENGEIHDLFQAERVGPVRWSDNGQSIEFVALQKEAGDYINVFYTIDRNGENQKATLTVKNLGNWIHWGDWSPNARELVFTLDPHADEVQAGLYVLDLQNGHWQQVLTDYAVYQTRTWSAQLP